MKVFGSYLCTIRATETQNYRIPTSAVTRTQNLLLVFGSLLLLGKGSSFGVTEEGDGIFVLLQTKKDVLKRLAYSADLVRSTLTTSSELTTNGKGLRSA